MNATVSVRADGRVTVVTIERPERRNAVDLATARALYEAFKAFDADSGSDVAVLTGAGGAFCAGADLVALAAGETRPVEPEGDFGPMGPTRLRLGKPVIAAVEGPAVAGGMELALWCDLRIAGRSAVFGLFNRRFGVPLVDLGTIRLPRIVGHGRALELILTGRAVGAEEALRIGLVNEVAADGEALARALALAQDALRLSADGDAQRPAVGDRAMGSRRSGGGRQRGRARPRDHRERRDERRFGAIRGGAGRHGRSRRTGRSTFPRQRPTRSPALERRNARARMAEDDDERLRQPRRLRGSLDKARAAREAERPAPAANAEAPKGDSGMSLGDAGGQRVRFGDRRRRGHRLGARPAPRHEPAVPDRFLLHRGRGRRLERDPADFAQRRGFGARFALVSCGSGG